MEIIQSLRGLSVVLVVLYHCDFIAHGGFVGVDVFFVISGFLISKSLLASHSLNTEGRSIIFDFYRRRFVRLIPALSSTSAVTIVLTLLVFSPFGEIRQICISAVAGMFFFANGRFFLLNDYASLTADPFRHLWSLGVEEQFYIGFPILVTFIGTTARRRNKDFRRLLILVVCITSFVSFLLCLLLSDGLRMIPLPERFAFYSPITRAWQIGVGVLLAIFSDSFASMRCDRKVPKVFAICGFSMILTSSLVLDEFVRYPGFTALMPVVGSAAVIFSCLNSTQICSLRLGPLAHVGDLSYSLYLVHWPLLVLLNRAFSDSPSVAMASIPISYGLAWLQFRSVEARFRLPRTTDT